MEQEVEEVDTELGVLLPELWLEVMSYLRPPDLCQLSLVSSAFRLLCSTPRLWRNAHIKKIKFKNGSIRDFLNIRKYKKVKRLSFSRLQFSDENTKCFFENCSFFDNLEDLDLQGVNLSKVPAELLSDCCKQLHKLDLTFTKLTPAQCQHLFSNLAQSNTTKLRNASFKAANLSQVDAHSLAKVIASLDLVNLSFTELSKEQLTVMFEKIVARKNVNLRSLEFFSVDLSPVSPRLLGRTVALLDTANLSNTELRFEHVHSILTEVLESKITRDLNLDFSEVFNVSDDIFAKAVTRCEKVSLACSVMDVAQLEALFTLLAKGCAMRELDLLDTDLTSLAPELLGTAVNSLEKVNLSGSKLRGEQLDPMFQQFDFRVLADLNLDYLDISAVQPESLAMVLINLRRVSLKKCSLAAAQTQLIFETIARNEPADIKLRSANFYGNNLKEAAAEHLSEAAARLEQLDLSTTGLPDSAAAALLQHIGRAEAGQLRLRHLVLAGLCLARVAAEHITAAMARLEKLDLSNCQLAGPQLEAVLAAVAPPSPLRQLSLFNVDLEPVDRELLARANNHAFINHRYHI